MVMTARIVRQAVDDLESQLAIEPGRLETVRGEHDLKTTPPPRFRLSDLQQTTANPLPAMLLIDPDLTDLAAAAPGMAAEPGNDLTLSIAAKHRETHGIDDPGRLGVEFVQATLEKINLCRRRIRSHDQLWVCHSLLRCLNCLATTRLEPRAASP